MEGIGFLLFIGTLWVAYKVGHSCGKITGEREGKQKGYDYGLVEGARIITMAHKSPEDFEREIKVRQIVDAEFGDSEGYAFNEADLSSDKQKESIEEEEYDCVKRLSDGQLIPVNEGKILVQADNLMISYVTPEAYNLDHHRLEKCKSGKNKGEIKIYREKINKD